MSGPTPISAESRNAILAGLRQLQASLAAGGLNPDVADIFTDGGATPGLDEESIDALCEEINCGRLAYISALDADSGQPGVEHSATDAGKAQDNGPPAGFEGISHWTDPETKAVWISGASPTKLDWDEALDLAKRFNAAGGYLGRTDWRLPTLNELADFVWGDSDSHPFSGEIWSSSEDSHEEEVWYVDLDNGLEDTSPAGQSYQVLLVDGDER